ncbi:hypothetical protein ACUR5C_15505 [Aliikangiella sp. IMCC44653]
MTRACNSIIDLASTTYYHCVSRCVRRAFLCGEDKISGKNFEHRRSWIVERIAYQLDSFAIEVASYAIMSNHYHLVLRNKNGCPVLLSSLLFLLVQTIKPQFFILLIFMHY